MGMVPTPGQKTVSRHLAVAIPLFIGAALLDGWMTLRGLNGNPYYEGNLYFRFWMGWLGVTWGLVMGKTVIGLLAVAMAHWTAHTIEEGRFDERTNTLLPSFITWLKRRKPYWAGCVPLYAMVVLQLLAAWLWTPVVNYPG